MFILEKVMVVGVELEKDSELGGGVPLVSWKWVVMGGGGWKRLVVVENEL